MIDDDGLGGVTSNPTIFEKAIAGSTDYDAARLRGQDCHTMPVTERGLLVGLVTMDNVGEFLLIQAAEKKAPA